VSRRKRKHGFQKPSQPAPSVRQEIVAPPEPPRPPLVVAKDLPLDLVVAVLKLVKKHDTDGEILVKNEGDIIVVAIGDAAAAVRASRNPLTAPPAPVRVDHDALPRVRPDRRPSRATKGNVDDFLRRSSESKLDLDAPERRQHAGERHAARAARPHDRAAGRPGRP
jgi:hypothetical protein